MHDVRSIVGCVVALAALTFSPEASLATGAGCGSTPQDSSDFTFWNIGATQNCPTSCNVYEYDGGSECAGSTNNCDYCTMSIPPEILGCQTMGTIVTHPGYCYWNSGAGRYYCNTLAGAQTTSQQGLVPIACESGTDCTRCN